MNHRRLIFGRGKAGPIFASGLSRYGLNHQKSTFIGKHPIVSNTYTVNLGLETGDEFEIKLGRKQIRLVPAGSTEEEE